MPNLAFSIAKVLHTDRRYAPDAYLFVLESLEYAQRVLKLGTPHVPAAAKKSQAADDMPEVERHITGQELCAAARRYAQDQYGYLAKLVLNHWGVHSTGDFGEIVFNMIRVGQMRKTPQDRREDFDQNFDFDLDLVQSYRITAPPIGETSSV
jgi:uncharacterized repeat protein (TIGR04138 family)